MVLLTLFSSSRAFLTIFVAGRLFLVLPDGASFIYHEPLSNWLQLSFPSEFLLETLRYNSPEDDASLFAPSPGDSLGPLATMQQEGRAIVRKSGLASELTRSLTFPNDKERSDSAWIFYVISQISRSEFLDSKDEYLHWFDQLILALTDSARSPFTATPPFTYF